MKLKQIAALLLALVLMFTGCASAQGGTSTHKSSSAATSVTPFYKEELPAMGNIYLTTDGIPGDIYQEASIRVDWEESSLEEQTVQIKLRGSSSKQVDKKSFNIKFAEKTNLMKMGEGKKWSLLANPFDKSLMRIGLAFEYAQALGIAYTSEFRYCKLWLNDQYMGIYIAMEPIGDGEDRIDIDVTSGDAIFECDMDRWEDGASYMTAYPDIRMQINEPEAPTLDEVRGFESYMYAVYNAVATRDYTVYGEMIDIDSFVNFYIFNEVVKDIDFGEFSTRYYVKDGKLYAGPPWDMDLSMGNVSQVYDDSKYYRYHNRNGYGDQSEDSTQELWVTGNYYGMLMQDAYFRDCVYARWQEMLPVTQNLVMENELGDSLMDRYLAAYEEDFLSNYGPETTGWSISNQEGTYADQSLALDYAGNVEEVRTWLTKRIAWLDTQFGAIE